MKKVQTVFTARKYNKAARENKLAARNNKRQVSAFEEGLDRANNKNGMCYVTIDGVAFPTAR